MVDPTKNVSIDVPEIFLVTERLLVVSGILVENMFSILVIDMNTAAYRYQSVREQIICRENNECCPEQIISFNPLSAQKRYDLFQGLTNHF